MKRRDKASREEWHREETITNIFVMAMLALCVPLLMCGILSAMLILFELLQ